jgi:amino acid adenylation domain-containing protein
MKLSRLELPTQVGVIPERAEHIKVAARNPLEPIEPSISSAKARQAFESLITADLYETLASLSRRENVAVPAVLVTVFAELLRRYTGQTSVSVEFADGTNGVWNIKLDDDSSARIAIRRTHNLIEGGSKGRASKEASLNAGQFSYLDRSDAFPGPFEPEASSPIHLLATVVGGGLQGLIEYDRGAYESFAIASVADHYPRLLRATLDALDIPISEIEILSESDRQRLADWNGTAQRYPQARVDALFRSQAAQLPNHNAITFGNERLTYRELADRVSLLAGRLSSLGVGSDALVGIYMDRCSEMVIAMLAAFEAGGGYLPLDPALPPDRIAFMLEDARPLVVITSGNFRDKIPPTTAQVLCFDELDLASAGATDQKPREPENNADPLNRSLDSLAYIIYTSGSTGKPKGVEITHRALTNLLFATALEVPVGKDDIFLATATISFDVSLFEIFAPLVFGAHLVVAPRSVVIDGELLAETIRMSGATLLQSTPSGWRLLIEAGWAGQPGLKMLTAGEPLTLRLAKQLLERGADLWNLYGPTEGTVYATCRKVTREDTSITIGRPLANYRLHVLDRKQRPVPVGAIGELLIGGVGVARGYRNRPDLTAKKFVSDPFIEGAGTIYHTGDLARFLPTGEIELLGRADNQVKVRGYRIELDEIEAVLDSHPSIRKSAVKVWDDGHGDQRLVAYFVPNASAVVTEVELREYMQRALPLYMAPANFISLSALPLTPSGKIDRQVLPAPVAFEAEVGMTEADSADLEQILLDCWRRVLRNPNLTKDDNFFEVGGHSLLAGRLFSQIAAKLGTEKLPLGTLIEAPTVRALGKKIRQAETEKWRCLVPLEEQGSLPPLYLVHHLHGDVLMYWSLAKCFSPDRAVFGLQAPPVITQNAALRSFERLAELYIREILDRQPEGPYHLAGFSSGGGIAFEMAWQLARAGKEVGVLVLIDSDINAPGPPLSKASRYWKIFVRKMCKIAFKLKYELTFGIRHFIRRRVEYVRLLWKVYRLEHSPQHQQNDLTIEQALLLAEHAYHPRPYAGQALLIRFQEEAWKFGPDPYLGWSTLIASGLEIADVPGNHVSVLGPSQVGFLGDVVNAYLKRWAEESQTMREEGAA